MSEYDQVLHEDETTVSVSMFYCRRTLCISVAYAVMRCLCVCLCVSVMFVHCVKTNKDIFKFFNCRIATPFWFFCTKRGGITPMGTPLTGASNAGGVG